MNLQGRFFLICVFSSPESLSSFDESEVDSQSELEESTSSLNSIISSSSRAGSSRRMMFQSREVILSLDASEDGDQNYEDILRRNVRLWKLSSQIHRSFQEEVAVWYWFPLQKD